MVINQQLLDELTRLAKNSPRLRMAYDLRNTPEDNSQRMLNALELGTIMPIHRHLASSETVVLLRGKICWHSLECMESGSVLMESKDGRYEPLREEELLIRV